MKQVKFGPISEAERALIHLVALRVQALVGGKLFDFASFKMDLIATHCNGCPLELAKLVEFDDFNLLHDIAGIARHLNRETGQLENCFRPRCARQDIKEEV